MSELIFLIVFDFFLCLTGSGIVWLLTLGKFKFFREERMTLTYFLLSGIGLLFWLIVAFLAIKFFI